VPIIQSYIDSSTQGYFEPFVGGANMIDKIKHQNKIGYDIHEELIALLKHVQNLENKLPQHISESEYIQVRDNKSVYPRWYVGLVGFCAVFGSKYFGGYARGFKADKVTPRDIPNEAIRNIEKQRLNLVGITFGNKDFRQVERNKIKNYVVYCDIPYINTTKYTTKSFPYDKFYEWCIELSENNTVLISEYYMPEDKFECI
jgi:site-specific DNA-adenine methylase